MLIFQKFSLSTPQEMCKEQYREYVPVHFNDWEKKVTSKTKTIEIKMFNHSVKKYSSQEMWTNAMNVN